LSDPGDLAIRVRGQVQGVGFRPFVWQLAQAHGVTGQVLNDPEGVLIHAHGATGPSSTTSAPRPRRCRASTRSRPRRMLPRPPTSFLIAASEGVGARTRVTPDAATCADCLPKSATPADRRHGYAFANCTHCGPRLSILDRLPYDRAQTSMAGFEMCPPAARNTRTPATAASTPSPWPAPPAGRACGWNGTESSRPATARRRPIF
jgi:hydrogenase maturation protein HypF